MTKNQKKKAAAKIKQPLFVCPMFWI